VLFKGIGPYREGCFILTVNVGYILIAHFGALKCVKNQWIIHSVESCKFYVILGRHSNDAPAAINLVPLCIALDQIVNVELISTAPTNITIRSSLLKRSYVLLVCLMHKHFVLIKLSIYIPNHASNTQSERVKTSLIKNLLAELLGAVAINDYTSFRRVNVIISSKNESRDFARFGNTVLLELHQSITKPLFKSLRIMVNKL